MHVVVNESYDPKVTDLTTLILKLKAANVDVVLQSTMQPDSILFNKQSRQQDFNPVVVAALGYDNPSTVQALGNCINGVFNSSSPQFSAIDPNQLSAEGRQANLLYGPQYTLRTGRPQSVDSDETFSAAWVFFKHVLGVVGDDSNPEKLAAQARSLDLPIGSLANGFGYKVDANNYNTRQVIAITEWQDKKEQTVYPTSITKVPVTLVPRPAWSSICTG
jgi:branched-chain amino acid transport system substrate-binding protein